MNERAQAAAKLVQQLQTIQALLNCLVVPSQQPDPRVVADAMRFILDSIYTAQAHYAAAMESSSAAEATAEPEAPNA